ncbi:MAG: hypothetical protein AAFZ91_12900 [Pseudomonadota bacterium]
MKQLTPLAAAGLLFLSACAQSANEPATSVGVILAEEVSAEDRITAVLDYFVANPIVDKPVTAHPVLPHLTFSRHFNISRSSRAYLQLMTDPSKDASAAEALRQVAQYYLDHPEEIPDPDATYWAGEYHAPAIAQFGTRGTKRAGAISRDVERTVLEYMLSYVNYWSRPDKYDQSLRHETFYYWGSENHWWQEIVTSWGYLLALKDDPDFKDTVLWDGQTVQAHYDLTVAYMKEHMRQRAKKGFFIEISSGGYAGRMHNMYYMIHAISPDSDLKALATNTLDLWWTFWAEEQISGERGGGKVRHRRLRGLLPNSENHQVPAWYYFGLGDKDMEYITNLQDDSIVMSMNYIALLSDYRPASFVYNILEDRMSAPAFSIKHRRIGRSAGQDETMSEALLSAPRNKFARIGIDRHKFYDYANSDVLKYSWVSPNFILGTNMRPPDDVSAWVAGSAQGWWHGLLLKNDGDRFPERVVPTLIYERDAMGEQYAVQSEASFMTRKLPDIWTAVADNSEYPMGVLVSGGLEPYSALEGEFLFIESPTTWAAVRAVNSTFVLSNETLQGGRQRAGNFYLLQDDSQPVIIEAAEHGDYDSFAAFEDVVRAAAITYEDGAIHYDSLSGDRLTMFDDRSRPQLNEDVIDYTPDIAYDSRYVSADWDSGVITITVGAETHILDFMEH